jgi:hypothetical protein
MSIHGVASLVAVALTFAIPAAARAADTVESAQQLVNDVVFNELNDHRRHEFFEYLDSTRSGSQTVVKAEVETRSGRLYRMLATDGRPLTADQQSEESRRLNNLLSDAGQQQKLLHDYQGDEDRIARIIGLMPDGFQYHFDGVEGDEIRLKYQPNPDFTQGRPAAMSLK